MRVGGSLFVCSAKKSDDCINERKILAFYFIALGVSLIISGSYFFNMVLYSPVISDAEQVRINVFNEGLFVVSESSHIVGYYGSLGLIASGFISLGVAVYVWRVKNDWYRFLI